MNIFDMDKNSLPEQVQINKENIKRLMDTASINSFAIRAAFADSFSELATYTTGALVWHNDSVDDIPEYYLYQANQNVSAGVWDDSQWDAVTLKILLDQKQDALTFDDVPTENSTNPAKSGGIYNAIKAVDDKFYGTLLWENNSPTSAFVGGSISVDGINNFDYLVILSKAHKDAGNCHYVTKINSVLGDKGAIMSVDSSLNNLSYRNFTIGTNEITFGSGTYTTLAGGSQGTSDNRAIPIAIYGTNILI